MVSESTGLVEKHEISLPSRRSGRYHHLRGDIFILKETSPFSRFSLIGTIGVAVIAAAQIASATPPAQLIIDVDRPGIRISPIFYGLMTEEINHSYDGGLYAELIRNRAFKDDTSAPVHWSLIKADDASAQMSLDRSNPVNTTALTTSLKLQIQSTGSGGRVGAANEGFWGIAVKPQTEYRATLYLRAAQGFTGPIIVSLESSDGRTTFASASIDSITTTWRKYTLTLRTGDITSSKENRFVVSASSPGTVWIGFASLFPPTFNNRPNGNRIDLMEKLAALRPAFLRFPGGNYLEGNTIPERFDWKKTIGPLEQRPGHMGPWGYRSSDGMGLLEFLLWCEDLKMEPVLGVYAGYSLRRQRVTGAALEPFIQEALDEIEYIIGDQSTRWGRQRAIDGHPEPFKLRYVEIGNEDFFDRSGSYEQRFAAFYDAIKAKYPQMQIIATMPVRSRRPDVIDDHFYRSSAAMQRDAARYDHYDRSGPKIFVGEWATTEGSPTGNLNAALGDAAWLTGLERNSDVVIMQAYAPLLVNVNPGASQWGTNLIGYDALGSFGSPTYYVLKMFAENRSDVVLPSQLIMPQDSEEDFPQPHGAIGLGSWATQVEYKDIKVTRGQQTLFDAAQDGAWHFVSGQWTFDAGLLRQTSPAEDCRAWAGDPSWTDYTLSLKARKISGREGFLVMFHRADNDNFIWWNVGGWGNTVSALEQVRHGVKRRFGHEMPLVIQPDRWYDLRVQLRGRDIRCYLDGRLVAEGVDDTDFFPGGVYAAASRDDASRDIIIKLVNSTASPRQLQIQLKGASGVSRQASLEVLSGRPADVNSISEPEKVVPRKKTVPIEGPVFTHEFEPHSVNVLRIPPG